MIGGFNSGPIAKRGFYESQFNMIGEYKFVRCVYALGCVSIQGSTYTSPELGRESLGTGAGSRDISGWGRELITNVDVSNSQESTVVVVDSVSRASPHDESGYEANHPRGEHRP